MNYPNNYSGVCTYGNINSGSIIVTGQKTFENSYQEIYNIVNKKRSAWTFHASKMEDFDDFLMQTLNHINEKWYLYDQSRSLGAWVNRVVENQFKNKLRNLYLGTASPCRNCALARGDDVCISFGEQRTMECPLYVDWYASNKRHKDLARLPLSMENHTAEISALPDDSIDLETAAQELHIKVRAKLSPSEEQVYVKLFIEHKTEEAVAEECGFITNEKGRPKGYGRLCQIKKTIMKIVRATLKEDGLDTQFI